MIFQGSGRTERLSDLFQDKEIVRDDSASTAPSSCPANDSTDISTDKTNEADEASDREIVDILLAADLGSTIIIKIKHF